jgi:hypothetical protein
MRECEDVYPDIAPLIRAALAFSEKCDRLIALSEPRIWMTGTWRSEDHFVSLRVSAIQPHALRER